MKFLFTLAALILGTAVSAQAAGGGSGGHTFGVGLGITSSGQDDLNGAIDTINSTQSTSVEKPGSAYEFDMYYEYRFSGSMFAVQFRPSYFTQSSGGGGYSTKLSGLTFFPMLRMYPLENTFIHFFMQTGLGYGKLSGTMSGGGTSVDWSGDSFGAMAGLGAEFCFTPAHCMVVEGNVRYMPIERNKVTGVSGNPAGFDTVTNGGELERNNMDVRTSMSGIQGILSYQMHF